MNATKRKFNALLQGLSAHRPTPSIEKQPPPPATTAQLPTTKADAPPSETALDKRRRLEVPGASRPTSSSQTSNSPRSSRTLGKAAAAPDSQARKGTAAKYCPSDREELLRRLATFQDITDWTPKPDRVNEIEWAKRGWVCQAKERVGCVLCRKELVVKLNRKELDGKEVPVLVPSEIESALVDKYVQLIVESHQEDCLWRKRGCEDSLLRLPLANASATLTALRQRYDELCARKPFLPYEFNLRLPDELNLDQAIQQLPPDFFTAPQPVQGPFDQPPNRVALALAILGWQGLTNSRIGAVPNSASCNTCLRRLGLWMFKSKEIDEQGQVLVPAPMDHLDPVREHRFFCPWKNELAQSRSGVSSAKEPALPGWQILLQTLKNEAHLRDVLAGPAYKSPRPARGHHAGASLPNFPTQRAARDAEGEPNSDQNPTNNPSQADFDDDNGVEDEKEREAKDKERWARLRRVKSLFDTKGNRRSKRPLSRPGTGQSGISTGEQEKAS